jgi:hypothetical protein
VDRLKLPKEEIVFAAFGGWDAAGAKSFGYLYRPGRAMTFAFRRRKSRRHESA